MISVCLRRVGSDKWKIIMLSTRLTVFMAGVVSSSGFLLERFQISARLMALKSSLLRLALRL